MSTTASVGPTAPLRRLLSVADYHALIEAGRLNDLDRVELIGGELIEMPPIGTPHWMAVQRLMRFFAPLGMRLLVQQAVVIPEFDEPQPDLAVLRADFPFVDKARATDLLLAIEVADSSIEFDRRVKVPTYLRGGVPEVWIIDLVEARIEVHPTDPGEKAIYTPSAEQDRPWLSPRLLPDVSVDIAFVLGTAR